jgi:hypothetical protein
MQTVSFQVLAVESAMAPRCAIFDLYSLKWIVLLSITYPQPPHLASLTDQQQQMMMMMMMMLMMWECLISSES